MPNTPGTRASACSSLRSLIKKPNVVGYADAVLLLRTNLAIIEAASREDGSVEAIAEQAVADVEMKMKGRDLLRSLEGVPGIYAFSYGHYLDHPTNSETGATLIKVGLGKNIAERMGSHQRAAVSTHLPEPIELLKVWRVEIGTEGSIEAAIRAVEKTFHNLISTAGHNNPKLGLKGVGTEWFQTTLEFLDAIAIALKLHTVYDDGRLSLGE